ALLAEARLVEARDVLAIEERRGAEDLIHGDHAGAPDAGQEDACRPTHAQLGVGELAVDVVALARPGPRRSDRHHRQEGRTVATEARVILVARGLVDLGFAAELGLDGLDRQAVRLDTAVAAAFADQLVDHHAHGGIRQLPTLPEPALLGGASLVVDESRHAGR